MGFHGIPCMGFHIGLPWHTVAYSGERSAPIAAHSAAIGALRGAMRIRDRPLLSYQASQASGVSQGSCASEVIQDR